MRERYDDGWVTKGDRERETWEGGKGTKQWMARCIKLSEINGQFRTPLASIKYIGGGCGCFKLGLWDLKVGVGVL